MLILGEPWYMRGVDAGGSRVSPSRIPQGGCPRAQKGTEELTADDRLDFACYSPRVDYGEPPKLPTPPNCLHP